MAHGKQLLINEKFLSGEGFKAGRAKFILAVYMLGINYLLVDISISISALIIHMMIVPVLLFNSVNKDKYFKR
ncbi:hypothetical protein H6G96_28800 [Nostoc sp. FACHB-892]|uniref:hypothetical protein n=1 Tax=Nostoc sp. FACHB-892 TaxID=2692843 RepID=UPI001685ABE0|nr:hypothetical protein [Nostoc sp. FACHB-892]MBD2730210.1 hypothetical protein [Nostoc sp. FACHB-892]